MNAIQRRAYEAPIDELQAPPGSLHAGENTHAEVANGIHVSVVLTADVSADGAARYGRRGQWHVSVAVWPGTPGPPARPIPTARWTALQRAAAERVAIRNLVGVGAGTSPGRALSGHIGEYALHCFVAMSEAEREGLGLA